MTVFFTFFTLIVHLFAQSDAIPLGYGDIVHAEVTPDQSDFHYTFDARAGDVVLIDMLVPINTRLEPYLQLLGPDGQLIQENDERGSSATIGPLTLSKEGRYEIRASAFVGTGPFTLQLTNTEEIAPIAFDKQLEVALDSEVPLVYLRFDNVDTAMLHLEARQLDADGPGTRPNMRVFNLMGARVSDGSYFTDTGIDPLPLTPDTAYIIALQLNIPETANPRRYAVSIAPSDVTLIAPGEAVEGRLDAVHFFEAKEGQHIRVSLSLRGENVAPAMSIRSVDGEHFLIYTNATSLEDFAATFIIPASTLYVIEITDGSFNGSGGTYRLQIDGVE